MPGAVDWSVDDGAVDVSAGGELAEPAGDVDSCLEQADMSAMAPTHNNRTLRFIRSPHWCNGTVAKEGPNPKGPTPIWSRKRRSVRAEWTSHSSNAGKLHSRLRSRSAAPRYRTGILRFFLQEWRA